MDDKTLNHLHTSDVARLEALPAIVLRGRGYASTRGPTLFRTADGTIIETDVPLLHLLVASQPICNRRKT